MSGKEADLFIVAAAPATLRQALQGRRQAQLQEGRSVLGGPQGAQQPPRQGHGEGLPLRAAAAGELWQNAEVDALYRLQRAGVRVPEPYGCFDGVLLMELIVDESGDVRRGSTT
jgi:RIO kinase 1